MCYGGRQGGCVVENLREGTGYRFKVECAGRRTSFAIYSTVPLPPMKPIGLEWLGGDKQRGLKLKIREASDSSKMSSGCTIRVEHCLYSSSPNTETGRRNSESQRSEEDWSFDGDTKGDSFILKGLKIGKGVKVRTRFVLGDGTCGVHSDILDLGVAPRRSGIIVLDYDADGDTRDIGDFNQSIEEGSGDDDGGGGGENALRDSNPILDFKGFIEELQALVPKRNTRDDAAGATAKDGCDLPEGWKEVYSEKHDRNFYHDEISGRSCWTKPQTASRESL